MVFVRRQPSVGALPHPETETPGSPAADVAPAAVAPIAVEPRRAPRAADEPATRLLVGISPGQVRASPARARNRFVRELDLDPRLRAALADPGPAGLFRFLRADPYLEELDELIADSPEVHAHGDLHLQQLVWGGGVLGLTDLDRTRRAPYGVDVVRFLMSMGIRAPEGTGRAEVGEAFLRGHASGLANPYGPRPVADFVTRKALKPYQVSARAYLDRDNPGPLARKMRQALARDGDPEVRALVDGYAATLGLGPGALKIVEAGFSSAFGVGSFGVRRLLVSVVDQGGEPFLLELKQETRSRSTHQHAGAHIQSANAVYETSERRQGYVSHGGAEWWGHEILPDYEDVADPRTPAEAIALAEYVGRLLGRAHARTATNVDALRVHAERNVPRWIELAADMERELRAAHRLYGIAARAAADNRPF